MDDRQKCNLDEEEELMCVGEDCYQLITCRPNFNNIRENRSKRPKTEKEDGLVSNRSQEQEGNDCYIVRNAQQTTDNRDALNGLRSSKILYKDSVLYDNNPLEGTFSSSLSQSKNIL